MPRILIYLSLFFIFTAATAKSINIVAAENFYGDIAKIIGGPYVHVTNILNNPNQDPHLFSSSPATALAIAKADLVVYNGLNYDPWMEGLIQASGKSKNQILSVASLLNKKVGDNPHIWYSPLTMPIYAERLAKILMQIDPEHKDYYSKELLLFTQRFSVLLQKIAKLKKQFHGVQVIATEPVFNYMADALGLVIEGKVFQINIMNGTEPSAKDTQNFEDNIRQHKIKLLLYNKQVANPLTEKLQDLSKEEAVPVVGISETLPSGLDYINWMQQELESIEKALSR